MNIRIQKYNIIPIITLFFFISCSFFSMNERDAVKVHRSISINVKDYKENNSSVIMGNIRSANLDQPVVVVACPAVISEDTRDNYSYVILESAKEYMIYLPAGDYYVFAILDSNNDFLFEDNETAACFGKPDKISVANNEIKTGIDITVTQSKQNIKFPGKFSVKYDVNSIEYTAENGQVRKIYSEIFSINNAKIGWWYPSLFMRAFGANIYLTEKYDSNKIPILFVHGASGSPADWVYFYLRLDKKKYQPMYFYYPAGMRLTLLSRLLYLKVMDLKQRFGFKKLYIAAHSMGGLVSRAMLLNNYDDIKDFVKLYITMATPWSGFENTDVGLKTAPYLLPSWIDVSAQSMFIKTTMGKSIPATIEYYLFFGKNDSISKGSALDERAYLNAKGIFGFNTDHSGILSDRAVYDKFADILNSMESQH